MIPTKPIRKVRCAIYTRKSSEEGLDMEFNSLDAQRESCAAYIASQKAEGWVPVPDHYDDGGFSGGNLERPALKRLLADIEAGLVDVVVVYKIDRLSRSLMDFSKLVEVFDRNGVTFVSVTQSFNTTTSMGRLTLNILLSFAQFEREVIGERIRDKFAASRRKGMWMGGVPPLGYDVINRKLVVNAAEADLVRHIFRRFLQVGSATLLVKELNVAGLHTKSWITQDGKEPLTALRHSGTSCSRSSRPVSSSFWSRKWPSPQTVPRSACGPRGWPAWSPTSPPKPVTGARHDRRLQHRHLYHPRAVDPPPPWWT